MSGGLPRYHHFIPAFYLRQWIGRDGKLIEYSQKAGKLIAKSVGPDSTGFEFDLYAFNDLPGADSQFLEQKFFDYADREANKALQNHLSGAPREAWTPVLISAWSRFLLGIHLRHPDAMPELRDAAQAIWHGSGDGAQANYEKLKLPDDPPTLDEFMAKRDPLVHAKMKLNLIIRALDNEQVGTHINGMRWVVLDVSQARHRLLTSDRPIGINGIIKPDALIAIPISPTKAFVATNEHWPIEQLMRTPPDELVLRSNQYVCARARRYVWAQDRSQTKFIEKYMSVEMEQKPFFPNVGKIAQAA